MFSSLKESRQNFLESLRLQKFKLNPTNKQRAAGATDGAGHEQINIHPKPRGCDVDLAHLETFEGGGGKLGQSFPPL